jgi:hypothetical protein
MMWQCAVFGSQIEYWISEQTRNSKVGNVSLNVAHISNYVRSIRVFDEKGYLVRHSDGADMASENRYQNISIRLPIQYP